MSDHTPSEKFWFVFSVILWTTAFSITVVASIFYFDVLPIMLMITITGTFAAYAAAIFSLKKENPDIPTRFTVRVCDKILPIKLIFFGSIIFFPINFISGMIHLWEGSPSTMDGAYWLTSHGNIIREITLNEYILLSMAEMRLMAGCLLTFIAVPVAHFGIRNKSYKKEK